MPSPDPQTLNDRQRRTLLEVARRSIRHGLDYGAPLAVNPDEFPEALGEQRAAFVTLNRQGELRGCIGHLEAIQPLVKDVAENAFAAAFHDPRFPPLEDREFADLAIHISVLTIPQPLHLSSEEDLLRQIRPGVDGLILADGRMRGTFLPSVWESLPEPRAFLSHLKLKAGLPADYWSDSLQAFRYQTESFSDR